MMDAQSADIFAKFKRCWAYEIALELKEEVQIQFNYVDYDDAAVENRKCYEVCRKFHKPVIVMEPCKGGNLVNLPEDAQNIFDELHRSGDAVKASKANYAIRFAAGFEGIMMVLSGVSNMGQMKDNIGFMKDFRPLPDKELDAIHKVCDIFQSKNMISCTACRYCTDGCPKNISIPDLFACLNAKKVFQNWNTDYYNNVHTVNNGKASDCVNCGKCETVCPQHLPIRELLAEVAGEFESK